MDISIDIKKEEQENNKLFVLLQKMLRNTPAMHILFWVLFVSSYALVNLYFGTSLMDAFAQELILLPVILVFVYFNLYRLVPRLLLKKRYITYLCSFIIWWVGISFFAQYFVFWKILHPLYCTTANCKGEEMGFYQLFRILINFNMIAGATTTVSILKKWYREHQDAMELSQEKLEAELNFLRSQIHPHFLFNTLNNLYSLTLKQSEKAPEVVLKLSELMHYMLYETNNATVSLEKEVSYLRNYIELEKLRYGNKADISMNVSGEVQGSVISPLILLPFVENSFKHGISSDPEGSWLTIDIKVKSGVLYLTVNNSKGDRMQQPAVMHGIGLTNVKRRLELLYPKRHELVIRDEEDNYLVELKLQLNDIKLK